MKKRLLKTILGVVVAVTVFMTTGCGNKQAFDTVYTYNKAIIELQNGEVIEGKVEKWTDYADGDQLQVKIAGVTYLVHSSKVTLIKE